MAWHDRKALYERLDALVGRTPLKRLDHLGPTEAGGIFLKQEYLNPTGSHYDRIILELLRQREEAGEIEPGHVLLDTTTGNSGASLAWFARVLGFKCKIIIPEDAPRARIRQIKSYGASVEYSPAGQYTDGLIATLNERIRERKDWDFVLDHATDPDAAAAAMRKLGSELLQEFARTSPGDDLTHLVVGLGNGASVHVAEPLKDEECRVVGFEPIEAPMNFLQMYSEETLKQRYGPAPPPSLEHGLWGTGAGTGNGFKWPIMREAWGLLDEIKLVSQQDWRRLGVLLADEEGLHVGRSTAAGVAIALQIVEESEEPANVACIAYDAAWKYLGNGDDEL